MRDVISRLFRPAEPAREDPSPLAILTKRLEESLQRPLLRIPADDLPEDVRALVAGLNARLDALASAEKEQHQFIADVSHELRTPLTILRGSLEVALEEERPAEEYREAIGNALLEVRHLTRLSQNLLFLTRGESGRVTLSFANLELGKFAADVVRDLALASAERGLDLSVETPKAPVYVFADSGRLQQVMHNLLENAMRYTEHGGKIRVRVEAAPGRGAALGVGHRRGHSGGRPTVRVRALLPQQGIPHRQSGRVGPGALHRALDRGGPQGQASRSTARSGRARRSRCGCR